MTPMLLHAVAEKVAPHKKKLIQAAIASGITTSALFLMAYFSQQSNIWLSLGLWASVVVLFWGSWLLSIAAQFQKTPTQTPGFIGSIQFILAQALNWVSAVFMSLWLVGLAYVTFAALLRILFGYGS